jgi:16S rRNA (guanine966-N2)-methyltransferase
VRIVGGALAGRELVSPADRRVRPTAEPVRGWLLDLLAAEVPRARVLDLFAGSGALGLEALSRGAASCDFVEFRPASLHALRANVTRLRVRERVRVFAKDAVPFAESLAEGTYEVAFADPPYESRVLDRVLAAWRSRRFARVLAVEHARDHRLPGPAGERRTAGDTAITIFRAG